MLRRTAFVDDVAAAKDFKSGDTVRKTDFRGFLPSPYAGRVVFVDYRNGTVQVQWPWGSEQEYPTELIRDTSGTVMPPEKLDQTYSTWAESRFRNDEIALKADKKWSKKLVASVAASYEASTLPVWRLACKAHHDGVDEITAYVVLAARFSDEFGDDAVRLTVSNLYAAPEALASRIALYWKDKGRRYKVTQREKRVGHIRCPRCSTDGMKQRTYRANKKVLTCPKCGFSISPKDLIWDDANGVEMPQPVPSGTVASSPAGAMFAIAAAIASSDPSAAAAIEVAVARIAGVRPRVSVVNPGFKGWEQHMEEMVGTLKALDQELGKALSDYDDADEFAKFFEDGVSEEEELRNILDRTKQLGKVASHVSADEQTSGFNDFFKNMRKKFKKDEKKAEDGNPSLPAQYRLDDKAMDDFVEGSRDWLDASQYVEMEFAENRDFFDGANALLADMDDVRVEPSREKVMAIRDRIPALVKRGQDVLKGAREHLNAQKVETSGQGEPADPDDGTDAPVHGDAHAPGDPKHLQWTVKHYVDMLRESLEDPEKTKKYLRELYNEVGPQLKAATEARRIITPILVRLAQTRPSTRSLLLPILRTAAGR